MKVYVDAEDAAALPERHFRADCPALLGRPVEKRDAADPRPTRRCSAGCWARYERRRRSGGAGFSSLQEGILRPVQRQKVFFACIVAVLVAAALVVTFSRTRLYQSQATISVYPRKGVPLFSGYQEYSSVVLGTYAQLLQSRNFLSGVSQDISSHPSPNSIKGNVTVSPVANTTVLNLTAHASSGSFASELAQVTAGHLSTAIDRSPQFQAFITQSATPPKRPLGPNRVWLVVGSVVGALLLGLVAVLVRDRVFGFLRGPNEVAATVGAPIWGAIPAAAALRRSDVLMAERESSMRVAGAFDSLASNLLSIDNPASLRIIAVAGMDVDPRALAAVAANLGWALSDLGEPTTVVDANTVQPRLNTLLATEPSEGFSELGLAPDDDVSPSPVPTRYAGLTAIPAGAGSLGAAARRRALGRVLRWAHNRRASDWCVLCLGLLDDDGTATLLSQRMDAVALVVSATRSREAVVADMCARIRAVGVHRVGLIVSAVPERAARSWNVGFVDPPPALAAAHPTLSEEAYRADM